MPDLSKLAPGKKTLLQGNEAIARGALEAGVAYAAAYPGNPSSEILQCLAESAEGAGIYAEWSANEKVALEGAAAASYAGLRGMASMKQNGVNVAADFILNLTISGCKGGLVLVTCDDPAAVSSTNEEDARFFARAGDLPLLEPSTPAECLAMIKFAFELSEAIGNMVIFRSISRLSHTRAPVTPGEMPPRPRGARWNPAERWFTIPPVPRHQVMKDKLAKAGELAAATGFNHYQGPERPELLLIASGSSFLYADEARHLLDAEGQVGILKLGCTWPLPEALLLKHLATADRILFAEEVDPFIENEVKALYAQHAPELGIKYFFGKATGHSPSIGELTPGKLARAMAELLGKTYAATAPEYLEKVAQVSGEFLASRDVGFCPGCPHRASYWSIKRALAADGRGGLVSGDIGCYTMGILPTGFQTVSSVHCMGSGLGISSGLGQLGRFGFDQPVISVVGDSTFYHAALPGIVNARWNQADYLLVVMDNSATAMTGFQPHPGTGQVAMEGQGTPVDVEKVLAGLDIPYQVADPYDLAATQEALYQALTQQQGLRALILRRACALVAGKQGGHPYTMSVDEQACRGAECGCNRFCSRVFRCPGLYFDLEKGCAVVDPVVCVGCGVCSQICPAGAIKMEKKD